MFSDCSCAWQMGKKKGRVQKHATRTKSAHEGSDAEESESGALSGASSEKQRLFETRAQLREAQQESLRLAGKIAEDDEADEDDDDDDYETAAQTAEDALATLRTKNAALRRQLQRRTGAPTKRSTWKPHSLHIIPLDTPSLLEPKDILAILAVRDGVLQWLGVHSWALRLGRRNARCSRASSLPSMKSDTKCNSAIITPLARSTSCTTISTWPLKGFWASPSRSATSSTKSPRRPLIVLLPSGIFYSRPSLLLFRRSLPSLLRRLLPASCVARITAVWIRTRLLNTGMQL